jgi:hypothetical protein
MYHGYNQTSTAYQYGRICASNLTTPFSLARKGAGIVLRWRESSSCWCMSVRSFWKVIIVIGIWTNSVFPPLARADNPPVVDATTDAIIKGSLKFLAAKQSPGGAWSANGNNHMAAITGYVLIAFMATGNLPGEGEYGQTCSRAVNFLLDCVRPDGYIAAPTGESNMYNHGIATIALGEAYGQMRDPTIRPKLERAVKLIIACQNAAGGWRYQPRIADADISVTVLQVVALRVARESGLDVPEATIDRAVDFVKSCNDQTSGGFGYQPQSRRGPGFARTAAAIYSLQVCGLYDDPMVKRGSDYLIQQMNNFRDGKKMQWFTYGNFYAGPAQYMIGGDTWAAWYRNIKSILLSPGVLNPGPDGSNFWRPLDGGGGVNEVYATAVYTTILAMPYGYLPLYQR